MENYSYITVSFIISFLALFMSLTTKKFVCLIKLTLSCLISFVLLKLIFKNLYLWSFYEYNDKNIDLFFKYDFHRIGYIYLIILFIVYNFFYYVLNKIIKKRRK